MPDPLPELRDIASKQREMQADPAVIRGTNARKGTNVDIQNCLILNRPFGHLKCPNEYENNLLEKSTFKIRLVRDIKTT